MQNIGIGINSLRHRMNEELSRTELLTRKCEKPSFKIVIVLI